MQVQLIVKKRNKKIQEPSVLQQGRYEGMNNHELFLSYVLDDVDVIRVELNRQDEDDVMVLKFELELMMVVIEKLSIELERLTTMCTYLEQLVQIFDFKEVDLKEEIIIMNT